MKMTEPDKDYYVGHALRMLGYLESVGCFGWSVQLLESIAERPRANGCCCAETKTIALTFSGLDRSGTEVDELLLHELTHAFLDSRGLVPVGADPHGNEF